MTPNPYEPVHIEPLKSEHPLWLVVAMWYCFPFVMIAAKLKIADKEWVGAMFELPTIFWALFVVLGPIALTIWLLVF